MKAIKYIITASVLLAAFSCRTLEEYNESPNNIPVGEVPPSALMDELICSGAINCQQRFYDTYAELMQYTCITSSSNEVISRYYIAPSYIENCWNNFARWSANADHMYDVAVKAEMKNYQAVALTLRAMYIDMLTATFGPIPFTEAFQIREGNNKPVFDDEKTIYTQLILDLEKANDLYKESSNLEDTMKDKLYYGDIKKWQKFSNSLMLRLLMRLSERDTQMEIAWGESVVTKVKRIIENPASYPVMTEYADNAAVYFTGEAPFQNGWGGYTESTLAGHRFTEHMYGLMKPQALGARGGDPRVYVWFMPYSASYGWIGIPSGIPGDDMQSAGYTVMNFQTMNNYKLPYSFMNCDVPMTTGRTSPRRRTSSATSTIRVSANLASSGVTSIAKCWATTVVSSILLRSLSIVTSTHATLPTTTMIRRSNCLYIHRRPTSRPVWYRSVRH